MRARCHRIARHHLLQGFARARTEEGRASGQQLVQDRAETVDVGRHAQPVRLHLRLFRCHVARRAGDFLAVVAERFVEPPGKAEVRHLRLAAFVQQHVGRFQVEVQDAEPVRVVDGFGHAAHQHGGVLRRQRATRVDALGEALPAHQRHREEIQFGVRADLVDRHDVGMLQARRTLRLAGEARDEVGRGPRSGREQLQRHIAVERTLAGAIDHAHAALTELFEQFVVTEIALLGIAQIQLQ